MITAIGRYLEIEVPGVGMAGNPGEARMSSQFAGVLSQNVGAKYRPRESVC